MIISKAESALAEKAYRVHAKIHPRVHAKIHARVHDREKQLRSMQREL